MAVRIGRASPVMMLAVAPLWAAIFGLETMRPSPFWISAYSAACSDRLLSCLFVPLTN